MTSLIEPIKIKKGQKIAQLIVSNIMYPEIKKVKFLKDLVEWMNLWMDLWWMDLLMNVLIYK